MAHAYDDQTTEILQRYGFEGVPFDRFRALLQHGTASKSNHIDGAITPPGVDNLERLPSLGTNERKALTREGDAAIARGEVALVILAGGMATRFGGVVKALVPAIGERTFLDLKIADAFAARKRTGGAVPCYFMTSFATESSIADALPEHPDLGTFPQHVSIRLRENGDVFTHEGQISLYAPGHGDLPYAMERAGLLSSLAEQGVKTVLMSNVDNLTATLDPALIALHRRNRRPMSAEVVDKNPGDRGGAPACVDGHCEIVEGFRFPPAFDQDSIPVFNTNTLYFELDALNTRFELDWFAVRKNVGESEAIQFERLVGQLSAFIECSFIRVQRDGEDARFQPAKSPAELAERRPAIQAVLRRRTIVE